MKEKIYFLLLLATLLILPACQKAKAPAENETGRDSVPENVVATAGEEDETPVVTPEAEGIWVVDLEYAKKVAAEKDIKLFLFFTGSDWCVWCQRLVEEVFSDENFQKELVKRFVPVKIDFPRGVRFPEEITLANRALSERYGVRGFPTVVLADADGSPFGVAGYAPGGPEKYLNSLDNVLAAESNLLKVIADNEEKAKAGDEEAIQKIYSTLEDFVKGAKDNPIIKERFAKYYEICAAGEGDVSREIKREKAVADRLAELDAKYGLENLDEQEELNPEKAGEAAAEYRSLIDQFSLEGEKKQEVLVKMALLYVSVQEEEKAQTLIEEALEAAPDSELAEQIRDVKDRQEFEELTTAVEACLKENQKEEAYRLIDEKIPQAQDNKRKLGVLHSLKAEISILFGDIDQAKENFEKAIENAEGMEADMYKERLGELDPFSVAVSQAQLFMIREDPQGMANAIEEAIAKFNPEGEPLQKALVMEAQAYGQARDDAKAEECLEKAIAAAPESEVAQEISRAIARQKEMQKQMQEQILQMQLQQQAEKQGE